MTKVKVSEDEVVEREFSLLFRQMGVVVANIVAYATHNSPGNKKEVVGSVQVLGEKLYDFMKVSG